MTARAVIAYWGPGLSGKSTNLDVVREVLEVRAGELAESGEPEACGPDSVLFHLGGEGPALELFAPPGQRHHRRLRQDSFKLVDGVVFVVDSSASAVGVNLASLEELELLVAARSQELRDLPLVFQFNKRDLCDALELSRLQELLNPTGRPSVEAIATRGVGVFPALKAVVRELQRSGLAHDAERSERKSGAQHEELGLELGLGEDALQPVGQGELAFAGARWGGLERARGPLLLGLACLLGALLREVVELGWILLSGGG